MSKNTGIEWCDHTFNPWWGCTKVSPACTSCYAEEFANRFPKTRGLWGKEAARKIASEKVWGDPLKWNEAALKAGVRRRVFCASMADVFEVRPDLVEPRERLWRLIEATPGLDWLLLTKRPQNVLYQVPGGWLPTRDDERDLVDCWPRNVWVGTTIEDKHALGLRASLLLAVPAPVLFFSCEPLLEDLDLSKALAQAGALGARIRWVIAGGESGSSARPMSPEWARSLRDQTKAAGASFFFKQWGEWEPIVECYPAEDAVDEDGCEIDVPGEVSAFEGREIIALEPSGCVPHREWPDGTVHVDYQPRAGSWWMAKTGKKNAGNLLDGREWLEVPSGVA